MSIIHNDLMVMRSLHIFEDDDVDYFIDFEELSNQLSEAIENEDYEQASKIRDEIKRRK